MSLKDHWLTYTSWRGMNERCNNPKNKCYRIYGGRGITVCPSWSNFYVFLNDVGERPSKEFSLERIDNNKGYSKENCRWATYREQGRNKSTNVFVTCKGQKMLAIEAAEKLGVSPALINRRNKRYKDVSEKPSYKPTYRNNSKHFFYDGSYKSLLEISRLCGISLSTLKQRKNNGWSDEDAFNKAPAANGKKR